jgi:integrase
METKVKKYDADGIDLVNAFIKQKYLDGKINESTEWTYRRALKQLQKFFNDNSDLDDERRKIYETMRTTDKSRTKAPRITLGMLRDYQPTLEKLQTWKIYLESRIPQNDKPANSRKLIIAESAPKQEKPLEVGTVNLYLIVAKAFFRYLNGTGETVEGCGYNPNSCYKIKTLKADTSEHKRKNIPDEWYLKMIQAIKTETLSGKRNLAILLIKAAGGFRDVELFRAKHNDIKIIDGEYYLNVQGKGKKDKRYAPLFEAGEAVVNYQKSLAKEYGYKDTDPLFISFSNNSFGTSLSTASIRSMLSGLIDTLPIPPGSRRLYSGHSLRHSFVTWLLKGGLSREETKELSRHKDIKTVGIYAHELEKKEICRKGKVIFANVFNQFKSIIGEKVSDGKENEWQARTPSYVFA